MIEPICRTESNALSEPLNQREPLIASEPSELREPIPASEPPLSSEPDSRIETCVWIEPNKTGEPSSLIEPQQQELFKRVLNLGDGIEIELPVEWIIETPIENRPDIVFIESGEPEPERKATGRKRTKQSE